VIIIIISSNELLHLFIKEEEEEEEEARKAFLFRKMIVTHTSNTDSFYAANEYILILNFYNHA
jgi:hypothetical protein